MTENLIILAGGASSRMKENTNDSDLSPSAIQQANTRSKGLIEIGEPKTPFLHYLLYNAKQAGFTKIFVVIGEKETLFQEVYSSPFHGLNIFFVRQYIPGDRVKPFGTADAVFQALTQFPALKKTDFIVCNCDNLYTTKVFASLRKATTANALMGYDRDGLDYPLDRIAKFALMKTDADGYLVDIIEKPVPEKAANYRDTSGKLRVSMNIFKFNGQLFYPFLKECPVNPERNEKELPTALLNMVQANPQSVKMIPVSEHVIDLTSKADIETVGNYLKTHYKDGLQWN